jgi:hypothetical protein
MSNTCVDGDGQVCLAEPDERGGIQPVISVTANGAARADVDSGAAVELAFTARVPSGTGPVISVDWDLDGNGTFATPVSDIDGRATTVGGTTTVSFADAGTHFVGVRVVSHRAGQVNAVTDRIENVARARIVVN